jgi:acyl-CoA hydrolase
MTQFHRGKVGELRAFSPPAFVIDSSASANTTGRSSEMPGETISSEEAASFVKSGMWLDYGTLNCQPDVFDRALAARKDLANVKIRSCLSLRPRAVIEDDPEGKHFHMFSWHFSGYDRGKHDAGRCNYVPLNLGEVPDYYRRFLDPVDLAILKTCPMDEGGYFNFGPANMWHRAVVERSKLVIVEINREMPYVFGKENGVHLK